MTQDEDYLRMLAIGHYVVGGILALVACIPLFQVIVGLLMVFRPEIFGDPSKQPPIIGWLFAGFAAILVFVGWILAILILRAAHCLQRRKHHTYCLVVAGVACLFMPMGTALGVSTFIVLSRPGVKALFGQPIPATR